MKIVLRVNGEEHTEKVEPRMLLVDLLRDRLGLTGTHIGCGVGQCGACTVLLDDQAVKACCILAVQADGCEVVTVEGLHEADRLHPIQEGFWQEHGLQCGFCTPGMIMAAYGFLQQNPNPEEREIREAIHGNLCRCTGYQNIVKAIQYAARKLDSP